MNFKRMSSPVSVWERGAASVLTTAVRACAQPQVAITELIPAAFRIFVRDATLDQTLHMALLGLSLTNPALSSYNALTTLPLSEATKDILLVVLSHSLRNHSDLLLDPYINASLQKIYPNDPVRQERFSLWLRAGISAATAFIPTVSVDSQGVYSVQSLRGSHYVFPSGQEVSFYCEKVTISGQTVEFPPGVHLSNPRLDSNHVFTFEVKDKGEPAGHAYIRVIPSSKKISISADYPDVLKAATSPNAKVDFYQMPPELRAVFERNVQLYHRIKGSSDAELVAWAKETGIKLRNHARFCESVRGVFQHDALLTVGAIRAVGESFASDTDSAKFISHLFRSEPGFHVNTMAMPSGEVQLVVLYKPMVDDILRQQHSTLSFKDIIKSLQKNNGWVERMDVLNCIARESVSNCKPIQSEWASQQSVLAALFGFSDQAMRGYIKTDFPGVERAVRLPRELSDSVISLSKRFKDCNFDEKVQKTCQAARELEWPISDEVIEATLRTLTLPDVTLPNCLVGQDPSRYMGAMWIGRVYNPEYALPDTHKSLQCAQLREASTAPLGTTFTHRQPVTKDMN